MSRRGAPAAIVARWRAAGSAEAAVLSAGPRWVWLTKAGLAASGLPYRLVRPAYRGWRTCGR